MPQSLTHILVHLVFSTKNREALIAPEARPELFAYLGGTLSALDCPAIAIGGVGDHVHLLFVLSKNIGLSKVVEAVAVGLAQVAGFVGIVDDDGRDERDDPAADENRRERFDRSHRNC